MAAFVHFMAQKSIYLNGLIIRSSGINDHGEASSFNSFKSRYHNLVVWGLNPWTWDLNVFFDARSPSGKIRCQQALALSICCVFHMVTASLHFSYLNKAQLGTRGSTEGEKYLLGL